MEIKGRCLECYKGKMVHHWGSWHNCDNPLCHGDSDDVVDGYAYPTERRGTLCKEYTAVRNFKAYKFEAGQEITFKTAKGKAKRAIVIHVDSAGNRMIIREVGKKKVKLIVDNQVIADSYSALFPCNKKIYAGWWNKRLTLGVV
ncbi:hypothetical protein Kirov_232 [Bacillus phage Kirov]|uniref:Uncharacterized protein n=1 Tax=Bacillus phage Kirov TaxID=2783539 RepID=A0A7U3RWL2_9CAUD|nr:hypothetical protein PQE67_gp072 [Bacillus phage Kirov]QOV08431.1 hypothetical protein Kirov_232 [Bacillus phage Kirov]